MTVVGVGGFFSLGTYRRYATLRYATLALLSFLQNDGAAAVAPCVRTLIPLVRIVYARIVCGDGPRTDSHLYSRGGRVVVHKIQDLEVECGM
jgi:hypothetical protein